MATKKAEFLALDPGMIANLYRRDPATGERIKDAALDTAETALAAATNACERLAAIDEAFKADPTMSPAAKALKLRAAALKLGDDAAQKLDDAKAKIERELAAVDLQTGAPMPPSSPLALALESELRILHGER